MRISMFRRFSCAVGVTVVAAAAAIGYTATVQAGPSIRTVQLRDDCDPATFNAALHDPHACVGGGDTTFPDFIAEFTAQGSVDEWRFNPDRSEADRGVNTQNRGGEAHTFTEVKEFGGGFIGLLNGGAAPAPECAKMVGDELVPTEKALATLVPAGANGPTTQLAKGTHKFQCCIHPWMQSVITIK